MYDHDPERAPDDDFEPAWHPKGGGTECGGHQVYWIAGAPRKSARFFRLTLRADLHSTGLLSAGQNQKMAKHAEAMAGAKTTPS